MPIELGQIIADPLTSDPTRVFAAHPALEPYTRVRPLLSELAARHGLRVTYPTPPSSPVAVVPGALCARHALLTGPTGTGKTRAIRPFLEYLWRQGCSGLVIDPKWRSLEEYLVVAHDLGIPPEQVFVLSPQVSGAVPRWPLFAQRLPPKQMVSTVVELVEAASGTKDAPRRHDLLMHYGLLIALAGSDLSLDEMLRAIQDADYRQALAARMHTERDPFAAAQVRRFLAEVARWSRALQTEAEGPATRLLRELVNERLIYGVLAALSAPGRGVLRLETFFARQQLLLIHLDQDALGAQTTALLAGLLVRSILAVARRQGEEGSSPRHPVVLCLDELPQLARFVGEELERVVSMARSMGLWLILAAQYASQLPTGLRESLTKQCAVQAHFRSDFAEAQALAAAATAGMEASVAQVALAPQTERGSGELTYTAVSQPILDGESRPLRLTAEAWTALKGRSAAGVPFTELRQLCAAAGVRHLFIRSPGSGEPVELGAYVRSLSPCRWFVDGPRLLLRTVLPRVRLERTVVRSTSELAGRLAHIIEQLPNRHCLLRLDNRLVGVVKVREVPDLPFGPEHQAYLRQILSINGQSDAEILATLRERARRMDALASRSDLVTAAGRTAAVVGAADGSRW